MTIERAEVIVTQTPREGWQVASDAGETVAMDVSITPELHREGLAREAIRVVQHARKADGLDVGDRITLRWAAASPELATALAEHEQLIAGEVLATEFCSGAGPRRAHRHRARRRGPGPDLLDRPRSFMITGKVSAPNWPLRAATTTNS